MGTPAFPVTPTPTLAGFTAWIVAVGGVPTQYVPDAQWIFYAYNTAVGLVNPAFQAVPGPDYLQMVYNLGMDRLVNWAPDTGTPPPVYKEGLSYFNWLRKDFNVNQMVAGVVSAASDEGTNSTLTVPKQFENLTLAQLQNLKTPWGQAYVGAAMAFGTNWGLS